MAPHLFHPEFEGLDRMSIVKNDTDQLPEDLIDERAKTYTAMMKAGYLILAPISLGVVMMISLLMLGVGGFTSFFLGVLAGIFVYTFSKVFLVH
ncbi:MAG: hypothetical protein AAF830_04920 [Pseudomonadota bacterium]